MGAMPRDPFVREKFTREAAVDGFETRWNAERAKLGTDEAARFSLELRNFSQKEGRVSVVGASDQGRKWRYMFAGTEDRVPDILLNRDVADCLCVPKT
jgi:hypothetical protein